MATCKRINGNIVFTISEEALLSGIKHTTHGAFKVTDKEKYLNAFCSNFTDMTKRHGDGEIALNVFLDDIVLECSDSDDGIEPIELE